MPLIIITGLPTSGKSTRAAQLHAYLAARIQSEAEAKAESTSTSSAKKDPAPRYRLHLISDQTLRIPRTVYDLSPASQTSSTAAASHTRGPNAAEKDARAALYAATKRALSPRDVVVLDGLNYIKGWRYQLYCEAKNARTPSCVVQVGCGVERARKVNEARLLRQRRRRGGHAGTAAEEEEEEEEEEGEDSTRKEEEGGGEKTGNENDDDEEEEEEEPYDPDNWENLVFRYEEPNPMTRWDSPLFTLVWDDDAAQARRVFDAIWDAVAGDAAARRPVKPNQSTVQRDRDLGGDYLYLLERETQDVVRRILERQQQQLEGGGGEEVRIPRGGGGQGGDGEEEYLVVELPGRKVGLPQLQRYRRTFVGLNRGGIGLEAASGKIAVTRLREMFVRYLNDAFEKDE